MVFLQNALVVECLKIYISANYPRLKVPSGEFNQKDFPGKSHSPEIDSQEIGLW